METTRDIDVITAALSEFAASMQTGDDVRQTVALVGILAPVMADVRRAANALETISKFELTRIGEIVMAGERDKSIEEATNAIAAWILANVDGEPSNPEQGAVATMARLLSVGNIAYLNPDEIETLTALRFGSAKVVPVSLNERAGITPSIVGIPDNAPFGPGPGGITPADKRFIPYSGVVPYSHEPYQPVMWHDGETVHGPVQSSMVPWSERHDPLNNVVKAYFLVD